MFSDDDDATAMKLSAVEAMGIRSRAGSYGGFSLAVRGVVIGPDMEKRSVWSSRVLMNAATPVTPSAPGLFSTITGCFQRSAKRSAKTRAVMSGALPDPSGTIKRTVRCGQTSANRGVTGRPNTATALRVRVRSIQLFTLTIFH